MIALRYAESMSLGAYLKRQYEQRGWSQRKAADEWGVPLTTLNGLVNDESLPNLPTLRRLADALQVSIVRLLELAGFITARDTPGTTDVPAPIRRLTDEDRALIDSMSVEELEELLDFVRAQRRRLRDQSP